MSDDAFDDYRMPFLWTLYGVAFILLLLSAYFYVAGWTHYADKGFFEQTLNITQGGETWMLAFLFAVPLIAQLPGVLYLPRHGHRDRSITLFYYFCLCIIAVSSLGYCYLWSRYTNELMWQQPLLSYYSSFALFLICVLLFFVGLMTYVIRREPTRSAYLAPGDLKDVEQLCKRLVGKSGSGRNPHHKRLLQELSSEVQDKVRHVADGTAAGTEVAPELVAEINRAVLSSENFYNESLGSLSTKFWVRRYPSNPHELRPRKRERCVRRMLDQLLPHDVRRSRYALSWHAENLFNGLKSGVIKTHFWALVFFFTVFLSITYLFAFAFAFDDKMVLNGTGTPALYMARNRPSRAGEMQPGAARGAATAAPVWPDYVFYFTDQNATSPTLNAQPFDAAGYEALRQKRGELKATAAAFEEKKNNLNSEKRRLETEKIFFDSQQNYSESQKRGLGIQDIVKQLSSLGVSVSSNEAELQANTDALLKLNRGWREDKNQAHLQRALEAVKAETNYGGGVLVTLKGGGHLGAAAPESPLLEERRQRLKYLLLGHLAAGKSIPARMTWLDLDEESPPVATEEEATRAGWTLKQLLSDPQRARLEELFKEKVGEEEAELLRKQFDTISDFANRNQVSPENELKLRGELNRLLALVPSNPVAHGEEENYGRKLTQMLTSLQETSESLILDSSVMGEGRDFMAVSVMPLQSRYHAIPLGLMDYVYFTVYTITTTGYGDIVPTTTYAKFLCTFANIIEVFFLVVFFNALLSVRRT